MSVTKGTKKYGTEMAKVIDTSLIPYTPLNIARSKNLLLDRHIKS